MQRLLISALIATGAAFANAAAANAQSSPAPSASPPAASPPAAASPSPSPTPFKLISISGSGDAGISSVGGTTNARFTNGNPSRIFDAGTGPFFDANGGRQLAPANDFNNAFDLQNANLQLTLNGSVVSAKFEGSFGTDADVIASNGQPRAGLNLTQSYLQFAQGPFTMLFGKFSTLAGAEVIEAPGNSNYSRSYLFGEAIPFTHTGVRATYAYNTKVSLVAGINNGWDDWKFAGKKKTLEGALLLTPSPGYSLTLDTYNGSDFALAGNSTASLPALFSNRMLYDGVLTVHPTSALTLIANYDNGTQLSNAVGLFPTQRWNGFAGYANYQATPRYGLSLRKETFHDATGFRTGIVQRLQSNTATLNFTPGANYIFRLEYRLDTSDDGNFAYTGFNPTVGGRNRQNSLGFETVVKFP
ncbi:MAG: porin [Candidatus Eremiobacteraeota bacterium]|nr:porin [Candidatus Eremiobacteraeota bacterium]